MPTFQAPRGTRDLLPEEAAAMDALQAVVQARALRYGYPRISTPIIENREVFVKAVGEGSDIVGYEMYEVGQRGEGGLTLPHGRVSGVYIRRDVEDESAEVDISLDGDRNIITRDTSTPPRSVTSPMDISLLSKSSSIPSTPRSIPTTVERTRRVPTKNRSRDHEQVASSAKAKETLWTSTALNGHRSQGLYPELKQSFSKRTKKENNVRPETYKQAWSVSEQHLLERLLEEIPDGEKNRYVLFSLLPER